MRAILVRSADAAPSSARERGDARRRMASGGDAGVNSALATHPATRSPPPTRTVPAPLALICSVALECRLLVESLAGRAEVEIGRKPAFLGELDGAPGVVFPAGV